MHYLQFWGLMISPKCTRLRYFPPSMLSYQDGQKKNRRRDPTEEVKARKNKMLKIKEQANEEGQSSVRRLSKVGV